MKSSRLALVLGAIVACGSSFALDINNLGTLGGDQSGASAINDNNQIVGWSWTANNDDHPFVYANGQMTDLYPLHSVEEINSVGQIAGVALSNSILYPAIYDTRNGTTTVLGSLGGVTSYGFAGESRGINGL